MLPLAAGDQTMIANLPASEGSTARWENERGPIRSPEMEWRDAGNAIAAAKRAKSA